MPKAKSVYIGVWENGKFIGVVIFGLGGGAATDGRRFGLSRLFEVAELERIALTKHIMAVSKIVSIALAMLRRHNPKLRLVISYADPEQSHVGAIYQAGNWTFTGCTAPDFYVLMPDGRKIHSRVAGAHRQFNRMSVVDTTGGRRCLTQGKFVYLYPLDDAMRKQIEPLRKPYPKKCAGSLTAERQANQLEGGGSTPTSALQTTGKEAVRIE